ncbi:hypothetical protein [Bradyrhizobium archetypum]|uniref:Uncharacterized protein n=1 Tax=Bradyrhizobium archetypum TaxID=2721160 RepID=A0A7Y4HAP8_9BRAD|nr:hypothetical protein [Bradyrhizobium archetypum]NOJ50449.1 hypothetical protein [Bradyrhizobium archetypum]
MAAADAHLDANRPSSLIVYKIEFGQLRQYGLAVTLFKFQLAAAADDLMKRNATQRAEMGVLFPARRWMI